MVYIAIAEKSKAITPSLCVKFNPNIWKRIQTRTKIQKIVAFKFELPFSWEITSPALREDPSIIIYSDHLRSNFF